MAEWKKFASPKEIAEKIKELISIQKANGYKPGWVMHRMEEWIEKRKGQVSFFPYGDLSRKALWIAKGEDTLKGTREELEDCYEMAREAFPES